MNTEDFLRAVWPPETSGGLYCIAMPLPVGFKHRVFRSIAEAAKFALQMRETENVYFCVNTLIQPKVWNPKHHREKGAADWTAGWSVRTQVNTKEAITLIFDLDVGPEPTKYQTQAEALSDLKRFCKLVAMPLPTVVSSGYGLHVYWVFDRALDAQTEWKTQAARLRQLAKHYGVKYDPKRTTDSSSVLRVPGTINRKRGRAEADVRLLAVGPVSDTDELIGCITTALDRADLVAFQELTKLDDMGIESNLGDSAYAGLVPPPVADVFKACGQMERLRLLNGTMSYGEWRDGIGVLKFSAEGREACHEFSKGDPDYDVDRCEREIDNWKSGPTSCGQLNGSCGPNYDHICKACPHVARNMGPVSLARAATRAPPPVVTQSLLGAVVDVEIPDPPAPYRRDPKSGVSMLMETKEGKQYLNKIFPYDLYPIVRMSNREGETEDIAFRFHPPHEDHVDFVVTATELVDERSLRKRLANIGIHSSNYKAVGDYMSAYIQELQRLNPSSRQHIHLGWLKGDERFVTPGGVYEPDGTLTPATLAGEAKVAGAPIRKGGTLLGQIDALKFYANPYYIPHQTVICAALGSLLLRAMNHYGLVVHLTGDPGGSKSSAIYAAGGLYGEPIEYVVNGTKKGATALWIDEQIQLLSAYPMCLDELQGLEPDVAKAFVMGSTQKLPRRRIDRKGVPIVPPDMNRSNVIITTGNKSIHQLVSEDNASGTAANVRVFEIAVKKAVLHNPIEANEFLRKITENFGWIGELFIRYIVKNKAAVFSAVKKTHDELAIVGAIQGDERFFFSVEAAILVAGRICNREGWLIYDMKAQRDWFLKTQLPQMRSIIKEETASADPLVILTDFISIFNGEIFKIGRQNGGVTPFPIHKPIRAVYGHYDLDIGKLYILKQAFRDYCGKRSQFTQAVVANLRARGIVIGHDQKKVLGAGSELATTKQWVFEVDMLHPDMAANMPPVVAAAASAATNKPKLTVLPGGKKP